MKMPAPDPHVLERRAEIVAALRAIVPGEGVIETPEELRAYESDGLTAYRQVPLVVVLPETTAQVSQILRYCHEAGVPVVPRGGGTSLSGGALPLADGVLLGLGKFNRILEIDYDNRCVVVQPGVTNLGITHAVENDGFYYAPDPSSQIACTIGGNVAENSGGVHCLKYGLTTNNVLGLELVLVTGDILRIGGKHLDSEAYDLLGLMTGSEGLLGVVTEVTVRILRKPETARALLVGFPSSEQAGDCVARIIGAGIIPGGMEMMDRPAIHAAEAFVHAGYPLDIEALLIIELDGPGVEVDHLITRVAKIAETCGATSVRASTSEEERALFWAGRKAAFPAVGRISPDYYCMDGTIPRNRLPEVLARMREMSEHYGLQVANVFHAGDGNLHPLILYDANDPGQLERAEAFGSDILKLCVKVGGVLTGEHGVGVEKRDLMGEMFNDIDLKQQQRVKCAFDDKSLLNPGKVFPMLHRCAELGRVHVHKGAVAFPTCRGSDAAVTGTLRPETADELAQAVALAAGEETPLEIIGTGTRRGIGRTMQTAATLDVSALSGITLYEPDELVMTTGAGTRLADVEAALAAEGQQFTFEPPDLSRLLGSEHSGTIGGLVASNFAGPRRIKAGAVRDHLLGFTAVSGRGEAFKSGSRVMKNVTGYDLSKLMAGSWGTLAVLANATFKVLPAPETEATVMVAGLSDDAAVRAMSAAMQSAAEVSGAAHLPADVAADGPMTLLRVEGVGPSVEFRAERLRDILSAFGRPERLDASTSQALWVGVRDVHYLADGGDRLVWRISVPPMEGPRVLGAIRQACQARGFYDWAGGLVWLDVPATEDASAAAIRSAIPPATGHATLIRAPEPLRASTQVFQPQPPALAALTRRLKEAFDPLGILNPGRMYP